MSRPCTKTSWNVSRRVDRPFQSLIYLYFGTLFLVVSFVRRWYSRGRCRGVEPNDRTAYTDRTPQRAWCVPRGGEFRAASRPKRKLSARGLPFAAMPRARNGGLNQNGGVKGAWTAMKTNLARHQSMSALVQAHGGFA